MLLLDLTLPTAAENIALDEALLIAAEERSGGEVLRFWEQATPAVIVGAGGSVAIDVNVAACERDGIPILRRSSGGGTVLLGRGCLCFSLILAYDRAAGLDQIAPSNKYVLGRMLTALQVAAPTASIEGTSDLTLSSPHPPTPSPQGRGGYDLLPLSPGERGLGGEGFALKISGNSQQRKRRFFLHHGTLLCGFDLKAIPKYLNAPERQPPYRQNRLHKDFLANLSVDSTELKRLLINEWQPTGVYIDVPLDLMNKLVMEKYGREDWNKRR
jgi:lipoate-protein ligase A